MQIKTSDVSLLNFPSKLQNKRKNERKGKVKRSGSRRRSFYVTEFLTTLLHPRSYKISTYQHKERKKLKNWSFANRFYLDFLAICDIISFLFFFSSYHSLCYTPYSILYLFSSIFFSSFKSSFILYRYSLCIQRIPFLITAILK